ncbi:neural-cadherin-like [Babylonia areolata]|uniref:neural-cadherin-like n=1 Tax=Babylonia areolata TaxID=304850 RepID=UPI003FD2C49E
MAARTMGCTGVKLRSAVCVFVVVVVVLSFASPVSSAGSSVYPDQQDKLQAFYFPNSQQSFGFRAELTETEIQQRELEVLRIQNELGPAFPSSGDEVRHWDIGMYNSLDQGRPQLRRKRDITSVTVGVLVAENQTGTLIDFRTEITNPSVSGRRFSLNSTSGNPDMFEVTPSGQLNLRPGFELDYEVDAALRTTTFVVHATSASDPTDIVEITVTLTVTDVNEPPVFITEPQPYLGTVRTNAGSGYTIITLVAQDPEDRPVSYEKQYVSPSAYNDRIELLSQTVSGVRQCQLRTVGSGLFLPERQTIRISVAARDDSGTTTTAVVSVLIGVQPPQFFQPRYQGGMLENNRAQQTVYKLGTSEELLVEWKTFQQGPVSLALTGEGGSETAKFKIQQSGNRGYIVCTAELDYEDANPKTQAFTLTAKQRVGQVELSSSVPVTVEIQDRNDNRPLFDKSQYMQTIPENYGEGLSIQDVEVSDRDTGLNAQIDYTLVNTEDFQIRTVANTGTPPTYKGIISAKRPLDYDRPEGPYYSFQVKATDRGTPPLTSTSNIRITVTNVNDLSPQFLDPPGKEYEVQETARPGQFITQVVATDGDGDRVRYTITRENDRPGAQAFSIDEVTGLLTLRRNITDDDDRFTLLITARDDGSCCEGSTSRANETTIYVQVYGKNSERPDFKTCSSYSPSVVENSATGTSVIQVLAEDGDRGPNGVVRYTLIQSQDVFSINSSTGLITVNSVIDREATAFQQVTVKAQDGGFPPEEGYCTFRVTIIDTNDNPPVFDKDSYVANITLSMPQQVPFLSVRAYDADVGTNARIVYSLPNDGEGNFSIIPENGFISLTKELQQSAERQSFSLTAMAKDEGSPFPLNTTVSVRVNVESGNTKPPTWDRDYNDMIYNVDETVSYGYVVIENMTCNSNIPNNNQVEFQLTREDGTSGQETEFFFLEPSGTSVTVKATGKFDYTERSEHVIRIRCLNVMSVTLMVETNPKVLLRDTNNQIPKFEGLSADGRYSGSVQEGKPPGAVVGTVQASDKDSTAPYNVVTFSIIKGGENFTVEQGTKENSAVIKTLIVFDREEVDNYFITIKAQDGAPSSRPGLAGTGQHNTATVIMQVKITDVNDNSPYFPQSLYNVDVPENIYINDLISPPIEVKDPDASDRGRHAYRIVSGNTDNAFGIRDKLGNLFPLRKLDYEGFDKSFFLVVEANDGRFTATTSVSVTIVDVNDNSPVFDPLIYEVSDIYENDNNVPRPLLTMTATDADVNRPNEIRYSLEGSSFPVNDYFRIDAVNGTLEIIRALDRDPPEGRPSYQFTVKAADERIDPNFGYATVSVNPIDVNDNDPQFMSDVLAASVPEDSPKGTSVTLIRASDNDAGENGRITFSIENIVDGANVARPDYFLIDANSGVVTTNTDGSNLDREAQDTYRLTIKLQDGGNPMRLNSGVLTVTLSDINDQQPIFEKKVYQIDMSENLQSGEVLRVVARDADIGENAMISYFPASTVNTFFSVKDIDNEGSIQIERPVDYENPNERFFNLTIKAQDNAGHEDTCYVEIYVQDFNDNTPVIQPKTLPANVSEADPPDTLVATFSATDNDVSDINKAFDFSISRASNPRRHFYITETGQVRIRRRLDRETKAVHVLSILAIDKGSPPRTGEATLTVTVEDVNDNYPTFLENYHPHIMENTGAGVSRLVQEVLAKDPDDDPYASPFSFRLAQCPGSDCDKFSFAFDPNGAGGNGSATITTQSAFDREQQKYYRIPIVMADMRGTNSPLAMTGTNTLTVTIADQNDNNMGPGTQDMFVYNYEGKFGPVDIGRVYVEDPDDWDLEDKTFVYTGPDWMNNYFKVNNQTGMVTMMKGVPSNTAATPYRFSVRVYDRVWDSTVTSTVSVVVEDLPEEAVRNSGATRFSDTSAEAFIKVPKPSASNGNKPQSLFQHFRALLAGKLNTDEQNVQIISVQDVEGGFTDVRYAVHGSPYYPSSQSDSVVALNKAEFERELGLTVSEVPIDACAEEVFEGGCYNYMDITGNPALVNSNGTSFVGVEVFIRAAEGCRALDFPDPRECSADYCYHGGTCVQNDFGVLSCTNCPAGFDGPRCQQLRHSFDGKSFAMYPTLEQCEDSQTSIEFITTQGDGLLLYNGPLTDPQEDSPKDFLLLQLSGGLPVLHVDHGSGPATLSLSSSPVLPTLADGKWHKIDIVRKGKSVEMIVDDCEAAAPSGSESTPPDTSTCRTMATTQGENSFLNVATLLQVGGRAPGHRFPDPQVVGASHPGFNGCVRNLMHNSKYYDLHYKPSVGVPSGANGCPREDELCDLADCGQNAICEATFNPQRATCRCRPGWIGSKCTAETQPRDLGRESFLEWRPLNDARLPSHRLDVQLMYRTWDSDGVLFTVSTPNNTKRVTMQLTDGRLQVVYNLDNQDNLLLLNTTASDGFWHVARFTRVMHVATLTLDAGEGRNRVTRRDPQGNVYMRVTSESPMYGGASVTSPSGARVVDRDLQDTCIQDVRVDGSYVPLKQGENSQATTVRFVNEQNVQEGCPDPDGCVPPIPCPLNMVCHNLWGNGVCRCQPGYHEVDGATNVCQSDCEPENPCFMDSPCSVLNGSVVCICTAPWYGALCNRYPTEDKDQSVDIASGAIAAIVVSIVVVILLILLAFFLVTYCMRKKNKDDFDKFVVEDDADFDIRENVMFYDEEGAGEEDQNAFDLTKLPTPANETMRPPEDVIPRSREIPRGRRVPDDRPDVGDVLHDRLRDADDDPDAPPHDTLIAFDQEGSGSTAGSLSSLGSSSSAGSQDYDYLNDWGPKFAKLADMYGAGQE